MSDCQPQPDVSFHGPINPKIVGTNMGDGDWSTIDVCHDNMKPFSEPTPRIIPKLKLNLDNERKPVKNIVLMRKRLSASRLPSYSTIKMPKLVEIALPETCCQPNQDQFGHGDIIYTNSIPCYDNEYVYQSVCQMPESDGVQESFIGQESQQHLCQMPPEQEVDGFNINALQPYYQDDTETYEPSESCIPSATYVENQIRSIIKAFDYLSYRLTEEGVEVFPVDGQSPDNTLLFKNDSNDDPTIGIPLPFISLLSATIHISLKTRWQTYDRC